MSSNINDDDEVVPHVDAADAIDEARATRFYDRLRTSINRFLERKGGAVEKTGAFLLLVPDVFMLLVRLLRDARITGKDKVLLGSAVAYYLLPFDMIPEAFLGPMGFMDDLVFAVFVLNKILVGTEAAVLREHWSGSEDVLAMIRRVIAAADNLVGSKFLDKIRKMVG